MPNDGSAYSDDEIASMLGHFTRPAQTDDLGVTEEQAADLPRVGPQAAKDVASPPSGAVTPPPPPASTISAPPAVTPTSAPPVPPVQPVPPSTPQVSSRNGQTSLLDQMLVKPSSPGESGASGASPTKVPVPTAGNDDSSVVMEPPADESSTSGTTNSTDSDAIARERLRAELKSMISDAQAVYRVEIKKALASSIKAAGEREDKKSSPNAKAENEKPADGKAKEKKPGQDTGKIVPPSKFEIKWEKNLRQTKGDPNKLADVIRQLGTTGDKQMTKLLKRFVSARKKRVRFATAKALRGIATPEAFYQLLTLLRDRKEKVARTALISLVQDVNAVTLPPILAYARMGSEERAVVAREIRKLESETVREDLLALAHGAGDEISAIAIYIAGQISDKDSVSDFSPFLTHADAEVRRSAVDALMQTNNQQVARFLSEALTDPSPEVRARAAAGLAKWPTKNTPRRLLKLLDDKSPQVRRSAAVALKDVATDEITPLIGSYLSTEDDSIALVAIIECVGRAGAEGNSEHLFALTKHTQEEVRIAALSALTRQGDQRVTSSLGTLLDDDDAKVRVKAIAGLGQPRNVKAIKQLQDSLKNDRDIAVRAAAAKSLGQIESKKAIPALQQAMYDDAAIRCQAVLALRRIGTPEVIPILVERLGDSAPEVRYNAVSALGSLESKESVPEMVRLIEDSNDMVRRAAHKALNKLGYGVSADLRKRKFARFVKAIKELIPSPQVAAAILGGVLLVAFAGVMLVAPQLIGLGPTLFIGKANGIDVSPDGSKVSILRSGGIAEIWNVSDGKMQLRKVNEFSSLAGLFSQDSKHLRLFSDKDILKWDLTEEGKASSEHEHDHILAVRAISTDRNHMLTTSSTKITPEYWGPDGKATELQMPSPFLKEVAMSPDGTLFAGVNKRNELLVLKRPEEVLGKQNLSFPDERRPRVSCLAFSDKGVLAIGTKHGEHRIIDLVGATEFSLKDGEPINRVFWIGDHLWSIEDGQIRVIHVVDAEKEAEETVTIELDLSEPNMFAISASSKILAVGSRDARDVYVIDTEEKKIIQSLEIPLDE